MEKEKRISYDGYKNGRIAILSVLILSLLIIAVRIILSKPPLKEAAVLFVIVLMMYIFPFALLLNGWRRIAAYPNELLDEREGCTQPVEAVLASFHEVREGHGDNDWLVYYAVYEYTWKGRKFKVRSPKKYVGVAGEGAACTILIDPDEPACIYEINNERKRILKQRIIGVVMMILGAMSFLPICYIVFFR